ncbi:hypothetical protein [Streptomyces sp. NPDC047108]|uniref:hypothetical protein n=1 Tax=Streptomyces sp. NPDC047108 TaxID=3155025 RepID=UPI0033DA7D0E
MPGGEQARDREWPQQDAPEATPERTAEPQHAPAADADSAYDGADSAYDEADSAYDEAAGTDGEDAAAATGPAPLGVPRTPTGNAEVDAQLERLADADHLPADGHMEVYEDVHRGLRDTLTALDSRPGPPPPSGPRPPGPSGPSPSRPSPAPGPYDPRR